MAGDIWALTADLGALALWLFLLPPVTGRFWAWGGSPEQDVAGRQVAGWGCSLSCCWAGVCPRPHVGLRHGQPVLASWQDIPHQGPQGARAGPVCPRGRGLHGGQGGERPEPWSVSTLAPGSLSKATENISPQTRKATAANGFLRFLPDLESRGCLWAAPEQGEQRRNVGLGTGFWTYCGPHKRLYTNVSSGIFHNSQNHLNFHQLMHE